MAIESDTHMLRRRFVAGTTAAMGCWALGEISASAKESVPNPSSELVTKSAAELALMIRNGTTSSVEIVQAHLDRISELKQLNAVAQISDTALEEAKAADRLTSTNMDRLGPLHGVPVSIKDQFDVEGMVTSSGIPENRKNVAKRDATAVAKLRKAGAIILCKTNVPTGCAHFETDNELHGQTRNPHDFSLTPGGSSGGEAALIAAYGSPLGLGGDEGGSIRTPAHFCGISGIRPAWGRVSLAGSTPLPVDGNAAFWTAGPMARSVADLELMLRIISAKIPVIHTRFR